MSPFQGHGVEDIPLCRVKPYPMLFDPFRVYTRLFNPFGVVNALKGLYILAQGPAPVISIKNINPPLKGANNTKKYGNINFSCSGL